jgi:UPF0716 protein FxsA
MWLLIAFIAVPLIEIALFIQVGGWLGLWPTLLIVVLTAIAGTTLVRSQGAQTMHRLRSSMSELSDPSEPLAHGAMILFSGALLLTPGFFTDAVGFALLIPGVRSWVFAQAKSRINVQGFAMGPGGPGASSEPRRPQDTVIDGEFEEVAPDEAHPTGKAPTHSSSGWTKH